MIIQSLLGLEIIYYRTNIKKPWLLSKNVITVFSGLGQRYNPERGRSLDLPTTVSVLPMPESCAGPLAHAPKTVGTSDWFVIGHSISVGHDPNHGYALLRQGHVELQAGERISFFN